MSQWTRHPMTALSVFYGDNGYQYRDIGDMVFFTDSLPSNVSSLPAETEDEVQALLEPEVTFLFFRLEDHHDGRAAWTTDEYIRAIQQSDGQFVLPPLHSASPSLFEIASQHHRKKSAGQPPSRLKQKYDYYGGYHQRTADDVVIFADRLPQHVGSIPEDSSRLETPEVTVHVRLQDHIDGRSAWTTSDYLQFARDSVDTGVQMPRLHRAAPDLEEVLRCHAERANKRAAQLERSWWLAERTRRDSRG
ncbi:hypothetical protein Slin15195_G106540 [Septoria linicola]|uniref:Uncharacterized protein n=1 Tax=Septoria linicola TaxID=215465 RepID=A0A9Q9AY95_9PEZI|nr:hypothetical protein Slin14017_G069510 [Septoria linicola]USW57335.1 hypothetical protein Slin15195_G106540 [Septoria linicola]